MKKIYRISRAPGHSWDIPVDFRYWVDCPNGFSFLVVIDDKKRERLVRKTLRLANKQIRSEAKSGKE